MLNTRVCGLIKKMYRSFLTAVGCSSAKGKIRNEAIFTDLWRKWPGTFAHVCVGAWPEKRGGTVAAGGHPGSRWA